MWSGGGLHPVASHCGGMHLGGNLRRCTQRAFRIGQKCNVFVHKFVCRGTIEERIDQLIESKRQMTEDFLSEAGGEVNLTEMSDQDLLALVRLDLDAAVKEG